MSATERKAEERKHGKLIGKRAEFWEGFSPLFCFARASAVEARGFSIESWTATFLAHFHPLKY